MNEDNKIFKTNEISIEISPVKNTVDSQRAQYYSYDENSGLQRIRILKDGQPLGLPEGSEIRLSAVKLSGTKQMMVYTPEIEDRVNGIVTFVIPKEFLGYSGQIRCTLYIDFSSDQTLHAGYFYINMGISDIDANLPEFSDSYWQRWTDFESEATTKMQELEAALDVEAQRLTEHANQKITEYDQKFQQTAQDIATLDQNFNELRNDMKLSEAWAWSADGTDRFTREYPRENLQKGSNTELVLENGTGSSVSKSLPYSVRGDAVAGKTVVVSAEVEARNLTATGARRFGFEMFLTRTGGGASYVGVWQSTTGLTNVEKKRIEAVIDVPADVAPTSLYKADIYIQVGGEYIRVAKPKVEIVDDGNTKATIYTPNSTEDPENAYPQYRGLSAIPSDNPADYVWEESAERIKQLAQQETDKLKSEVADIQNWIQQQGGTA